MQCIFLDKVVILTLTIVIHMTLLVSSWVSQKILADLLKAKPGFSCYGMASRHGEPRVLKRGFSPRAGKRTRKKWSGSWAVLRLPFKKWSSYSKWFLWEIRKCVCLCAVRLKQPRHSGFFVLFWDRVSLCSSDWPASASHLLGLKVCTSVPFEKAF